MLVSEHRAHDPGRADILIDAPAVFLLAVVEIREDSDLERILAREKEARLDIAGSKVWV